MENGKLGFLDRIVRMETPDRGGDRTPAEEAKARSSVRIRELRHLALSWPLKKVRVTSPFGQRGREFHEGIDLHATGGTAVYAAHSGKVLYAGRKIRGYGNLVVIRHSSGLATVYAHNSKNLVRQGGSVKRGQKIAISGNTGHVRGPHLHFEIRDGVAALDPMLVLPNTGGKFVAFEKHVARRD